MKILPVIHWKDRATALEQAKVARDCGADGVMLISHYGDDRPLGELGRTIKGLWPDFKVGLNFLADGPLDAAMAVIANGLDYVWADNCGVSSKGAGAEASQLAAMVEVDESISVLCGVAFKCQADEPDPPKAALEALRAGFVPCTSGPRTGEPPAADKLKGMVERCGISVAVASGLTPEFIEELGPYLSHALVATGVSKDDWHFDAVRLTEFIARARGVKEIMALKPVRVAAGD